MDDAHRGSETQFHGALADHQRILGIANTAAHHGIDIHVKIGVFGQKLELLVQHLQAFLRDVVGRNVVDADLEVVQPGTVQPLDAFGGEQIAIGDHARNHALAADVRNDLVQAGMQQRFAAADGDDGGTQCGQKVEALADGFERHRLGAIVVFVAVGAGQVAAPHGDDVGQDGMVRGDQAFRDHAQLAGPQVRRPPSPTQRPTQRFGLVRHSQIPIKPQKQEEF